MRRRFSQVVGIAALLSVGSRASSAQLACQFSRTVLLSSLVSDTAPTAYGLSVALNGTYSFNLSPQNRAGAADVTYRVTRQFHVAGGVAYCDTRLGIPKRPIFGVMGGWTGRLASDWLVAAQVGASYVNLELGPGAHQTEIVLPAVVILGYAYEGVIGYGGALVQYRHEGFPGGSSESKQEVGGLLGLQLKLAASFAIGLSYNLVRFVGSNGQAGHIDHGAVRLEYAFASR